MRIDYAAVPAFYSIPPYGRDGHAAGARRGDSSPLFLLEVFVFFLVFLAVILFRIQFLFHAAIA